MSAELLVAYMATITGVTIVITQLIKIGLIYPRVASGPARDVMIQAFTYLLNFVLLAVTLATRGEWAWQNLTLYILAALNQGIVSNGAFNLVTKSQAKIKQVEGTQVQRAQAEGTQAEAVGTTPTSETSP